MRSVFLLPIEYAFEITIGLVGGSLAAILAFADQPDFRNHPLIGAWEGLAFERGPWEENQRFNLLEPRIFHDIDRETFYFFFGEKGTLRLKCPECDKLTAKTIWYPGMTTALWDSTGSVIIKDNTQEQHELGYTLLQSGARGADKPFDFLVLYFPANVLRKMGVSEIENEHFPPAWWVNGARFLFKKGDWP